MALPSRFLEDIRARLTCSGVVGRRVKLTRRGREHVGLCPFHGEKTPSFTVNDDKGFFHCFGCGAHGDVIGFAMRIDSLGFMEAVENLAQEAGLAMPRLSPVEREAAERSASLSEIVESACQWFEDQLKRPEGKGARDYLAQRGLSATTLAEFRLGFAPDRGEALKAALKAKGIDVALMVQAGLLVQPEDGRESFDFLRGRVVFPIADRRGRVIAFGGRVLGDGQPKYLNSRDTPLFDKGRSLFAFDKAREGVRNGAEVVVVEGYMDAIALHQAGFTGAVAPLGTALTVPQIELLWSMGKEPILCFDGDAAGERAALRAAERALPILKPGLSLRFAKLPAGEDPDTLVRRHGVQAFHDTLAAARPLVEIVWESATAGRVLDTPERRAALEHDLTERLRAIADRGVQQEYIGELIWQRLRRRSSRKGKVSQATSLRGGGHVGALEGRRAQVLLATLVNHPALIAEEAERLSELAMEGEHDRLRQALLGCADEAVAWDRESLIAHLNAAGLGPILNGVLHPSLYRSWGFSGPSASLDEARVGWRDILSRLDLRRLGGDIEAAARALHDDMSEGALTRLNQLIRERDALADPEYEDDPVRSRPPPARRAEPA